VRRSRHDSDASPPRRIKQEVDDDLSPPRQFKQEPNDSDSSPPRRIKTEPDDDGDLSPPRASASSGLMSKTLDGKKAGLQDAKSLKEELMKLKQKEKQTFEKV
jgi:pre-mRNA-splicing factor CWC26